MPKAALCLKFYYVNYKFPYLLKQIKRSFLFIAVKGIPSDSGVVSEDDSIFL